MTRLAAFETNYAFATGIQRARVMRPDQFILANLRRRGNKDLFTVAKAPGVKI